MQIIAAEQTLDLNLEDLTDMPDAAEREAEAMRRAMEEARRPFDLAAGPLLRVRLFRLAEQDHLAMLTAHHVAADGWSLGILVTSWPRCTRRTPTGQQAVRSDRIAPAPLPIQYADYAAWQRTWLESPPGERTFRDSRPSPLQAQLDYWKTSTRRPRRRCSSCPPTARALRSRPPTAHLLLPPHRQLQQGLKRSASRRAPPCS